MKTKPIIILGIFSTLLFGLLALGIISLPIASASDVTITDNSSMGLVLTSSDLTDLATGVTSLATAIDSAVVAILLIVEVLLVLGVFALSLWKKNDVIFTLVAGLVLAFAALSWVPTYPQIAVPLIGLGLYQVMHFVLLAVGTSPARGIVQIKAAADRIKEWF